MLIVETVDAAKKRVPAYAHDKVISLADIAMYTDAEEVPLSEVLEAVKKKENGAVASINYKKASADELHAYFAEVLPNYDRDRVHNGDIKKLISWYNILVNNGITEFVEAPADSADKRPSAVMDAAVKKRPDTGACGTPQRAPADPGDQAGMYAGAVGRRRYAAAAL